MIELLENTLIEMVKIQIDKREANNVPYANTDWNFVLYKLQVGGGCQILKRVNTVNLSYL